MQKNNYQTIINFLEGKLSVEEKRTFAQWRKANRENEKQFQEIKFLWKKTARTKKKNIGLRIDVDAALAKVNQQLPQTAKIIPLRRRLLKYIAAASVLLLMGGMTCMSFFQKVEIIQVATLTNETKQVTLPDNSTVWLNENSTIIYPKVFTKATRNVSMKGEIIFEVTHNSQQPFIVATNELAVKVLGTKFNIKDKGSPNTNTTVHVINGKVQVQKKASPLEKVLLTKGMTAQLDNRQLGLTNSFSNNQLFWYHRTLSFEETSLQMVLKTLNQSYESKIQLTNKALLSCTFSGSFKDRKLPEIIETLQLIYGFEVKNIHTITPQLNNGKCN